MRWQVEFFGKAAKQFAKLPIAVQERIVLLVREIEENGPTGPIRSNWPNYGKLRGSGDRYHCHVKRGRPTYVVCWEVTDREIRIVEVYYAGTHEGAPY